MIRTIFLILLIIITITWGLICLHYAIISSESVSRIVIYTVAWLVPVMILWLLYFLKCKRRR